MVEIKESSCVFKNTIDHVRIIGASSLTQILTWVDASFAVHDDMRSHTGGVTSFGLGIVRQKSSVQKTNSKSSCKSEVNGVSEYLPYNLWMKCLWKLRAIKFVIMLFFKITRVQFC